MGASLLALAKSIYYTRSFGYHVKEIVRKHALAYRKKNKCKDRVCHSLPILTVEYYWLSTFTMQESFNVLIIKNY